MRIVYLIAHVSTRRLTSGTRWRGTLSARKKPPKEKLGGSDKGGSGYSTSLTGTGSVAMSEMSRMYTFISRRHMFTPSRLE